MCLIAIPFWWNGNSQDITEEIKFHRPDLSDELAASDSIKDKNDNSGVNLMTLNPPESFSRNMAEVPDVGELMLVSHPHYNFTIEGNLWWMGEKYDGIRCVWNTARKIVYTRYGNEVSLLPAMINSLPSITTDNELWLGRGQYYFSCVAVKENQHFHWPMVRLLAFDTPDMTENYERRYHNLITNHPTDHHFSFVVPRILVLQRYYEQFIQNIIHDAGEGVILQRYNSLYEPGRSLSLVKIKTTPADQEALVVRIDDNGSVTLKMPNERTFEVTAENNTIGKRLKEGDIVTYTSERQARQASDSSPVRPRIHRVRLDLDWDNVTLSVPHFPSSSLSPSSPVFTTRERGYWSEGRIRQFMVNFAIDSHLDPLDADTWIKLSRAFRKSKEGRTILSKFNNVYYNVLKRVFPEVSFDITTIQKYVWRKVENRRLFFEKFARKHKFDPLKPENWYDFSKLRGIMSLKGTRGVISYHGFSLSKALVDLFPNIGLDVTKLKRKTVNWNKPEHRRKFFENYAITEGFDPLKPENWYKQSKETIMSKKGAQMVLMYHSNSIIRALSDLFPEIGLDRLQFQDQRVWSNPMQRRQFFIDFAHKLSFDALVPNNWYNKEKKLKSYKMSQKVLQYHGNDLATALMELFPELNFDKSKFMIEGAWSAPDQRRDFFVKYAESKNFDPYNAGNWYLQSPFIIMTLKDAKEIMSFHNNSVPQALLELFPNIELDANKL